MIYFLILFLMCGKAFASDNSYSSEQATWDKSIKQEVVVHREPVVQVDRHVLSMADVSRDETVLIAKNVEVKQEKPKEIMFNPQVIKAIAEKEEKPEVRITATIESDDEAPVNYPL